MNTTKTIVITGCSSGFGHLTALEMAKRNWHVFATVRKEADREHLLAEARDQGCDSQLTVLLCDITDDAQVETMAQQIEEKLRSAIYIEQPTPHLDALVNNAGTAYGGPLELMPLKDLRAQFEINVIAHMAVTQALLPMLKAARGTIINVSSVGGRVSTPIAGAYAASKFALEALSDALRIELAPFGVRVVVIEPTSSPTNIWKTSMQRAQAYMKEYRGGPYERLLSLTERIVQRSSRVGFPAQLFVNTVLSILANPRPRARYVVPWRANLQILLRRFLPDSLWDRLLRRVLKW